MSISLILETATRYLLPLLVLFSIFLLFEGHHEPGGGFVGGLMAAAPIALVALAYNVRTAKRLLYIAPHQLMGVGLLAAGASGILSLIQGVPFLTALWGHLPWLGGELIEVGTPLLFDFGVYLSVVGVVVLIVLTLAEEDFPDVNVPSDETGGKR